VDGRGCGCGGGLLPVEEEGWDGGVGLGWDGGVGLGWDSGLGAGLGVAVGCGFGIEDWPRVDLLRVGPPCVDPEAVLVGLLLLVDVEALLHCVYSKVVLVGLLLFVDVEVLLLLLEDPVGGGCCCGKVYGFDD